MDSQLKVGVVGGLGLMSSPMARHWTPDGPVQVVRVHDRGAPGKRRDACRQAWRDHGAELVPNLQDVTAFSDIDGVFACCGKNGDDLSIIASLAQSMTGSERRPFLCHMSTVSAGFVSAAEKFCHQHSIDYVNYPLTGGPIGAEKATMLILASGNPEVYERLRPALSKLGNPKFFGENLTAATEVKLIGQIMVFIGLLGICSAAAVHSECFQDGRIGGSQQSEFFDFLNAGAGGTRQWDVILSAGIRNDTWDAPFLLEYGAIDAIYAAHLALERGTSYLTVRPLLDVALAFSFVLNNIGATLATHSIVREMVKSRARELDEFILTHSGSPRDLRGCLEMCIRSLPASLQGKVALQIQEDDFNRSLG
jgi:3-hydroxyisobutyrate dehydrogenase-like beta-hydroxyacid dehydrogenase